MKFNIGILCRIAKVSRSGYYKWLKQSDKLSRDYNDYLIIKGIFKKGKGKYGHRTILMKLWEEKGIIMNHKRVIRIMRKYGLAAKIRRKNPYKMIMKKTMEHRTCDNILERNFKQPLPLRVLCTDITYLWFNNQFAYLSVVKDIASREIVGWSLSRHLGMSLVLNTVNNLKSRAEANSWLLVDVLIHSDQGFHYTNPEYISMIKKLKMTQSMSRKGNCIDNSPIETFFGHLKDDIDYKSCKTFEELEKMVREYIEYYNTGRNQWELKKMTPVEYRNHLLAVA